MKSLKKIIENEENKNMKKIVENEEPLEQTQKIEKYRNEEHQENHRK